MKVILGLSGGVDSAVAAINLINEGYEVEGAFMRNWDSMMNNDVLGNPNDFADVCPQEKDYMDAKAVADRLGIKLHRIDFVEEYWENVFSYFLNEYKKGRTPNPDIICNKEIKFKSFLKYALDLGCDYIAMGHYAQVEHTDKKAFLIRGEDSNKDQTYFLCQLTSSQLKKSLFPIGHMQKSEVRKIAKEFDLVVADKKDSTGICFIGERKFNEFLKNYLPAKKGNMVLLNGTVMGKHDGLMYYTIGQRKGIKIGGLNDYDKSPWFVIGKNIETNELIIGQGFENPYLYSNRCIVEDINFINGEFEGKCTAKFRYRQADNEVEIKKIKKNIVEVKYNKVRAVTPGQACVFYNGKYCLGGGTIKEVYQDDEKRMY